MVVAFDESRASAELGYVFAEVLRSQPLHATETYLFLGDRFDDFAVFIE